MRFAVISEIQGNITALRSFFATVDELPYSLDRVVCAGDILGRGPAPNEVIDLLRERDVAAVRGNYDDAIAFDRIGSGDDFIDARAEEVDNLALAWTRAALTAKNLEYLQQLPRDVRLQRDASGVKVQRDAMDERTAEYRRTFFARALFGGLFRQPPNSNKRVLILHGSPRAFNEFVRSDTAISILAAIASEAQTDVLVSGHSGEAFTREAVGITFIGAGSLSGTHAMPGAGQFVVVDVGQKVEVEVLHVPYDLEEHVDAIRSSELPEALLAHYYTGPRLYPGFRGSIS